MQAYREEWTHTVSEARSSAAIGSEWSQLSDPLGNALVAYGSNAHIMAMREQKAVNALAVAWLL